MADTNVQLGTTLTVAGHQVDLLADIHSGRQVAYQFTGSVEVEEKLSDIIRKLLEEICSKHNLNDEISRIPLPEIEIKSIDVALSTGTAEDTAFEVAVQGDRGPLATLTIHSGQSESSLKLVINGGLSISRLLEHVGISKQPPAWGDITISDLTLEASTKDGASAFSLGWTLDAHFRLFGDADQLKVRDGQFLVSYQSKKWSVSFNGELDILGLDLQLGAIISNDDVVFTVQIKNQTLGDLVTYFVNFVASGDFKLQAPWSVLNDIHLDHFILEFNVSKKTVTLIYEIGKDFAFVDIDSIGLTYDPAKSGLKAVTIELAGSFLGKKYAFPSPKDPAAKPLSWAPLAEPAGPPVPGKTSLLDLRFLGVGQHLSLQPTSTVTSVADAIGRFKHSFLPPSAASEGSPIDDLEGLKFDSHAGWLFGADFTLLNTLSLSVVFNDPDLFGLSISLSGQKAGPLAGLSFQILYKSVGGGVGEYSLQLKLPNMMRHLEFGAVGITLPVIGVDIYTNSDFEIDLGFPYHNDFTDSCALDIFPFTGNGGFYFGKIPSAAAGDLLPSLDGRGTFNPVMVFGFGMQVGVGFSGSYGPLSASADIGVFSTIQGLLTFFHPYDRSSPSSMFFSLQGVVGITGWLRGSINFSVIQVSVDIDLSASAGISYVMYQPIQLTLSASVSASASVKIVFINIHFSVTVHVTKNFTIGSATPPPWQSISPPQSRQALHDSRQSRVKRSAGTRVSPGMLSFAPESFQESDAAALMVELEDAMTASTPSHPALRDLMSHYSATPLTEPKAVSSPPAWTWPSNFVYPVPPATKQQLYVTPGITAAEDSSQTLQPQLVPLLTIENPNPTQSAGEYIAGTPFGVLCQAMLAWALSAHFGESDWAALSARTVTAEDLEKLHAQLTGTVPDCALAEIGFTGVQVQQILHALMLQGYMDPDNRLTSKFASVPVSAATFATVDFMTPALADAIRTTLAKYTQAVSIFNGKELETFLSSSFKFEVVARPTRPVAVTVFPVPAEAAISVTNAVSVMQDQSISDAETYIAGIDQYLARAQGVPIGSSMSLPATSATTMAGMVLIDYFYTLVTTAIDQARQLFTAVPYQIATADTLRSVAETHSITPIELADANLADDAILNSSGGWVVVEGFEPHLHRGMTLSDLTESAYVIPVKEARPSSRIDASSLALMYQSANGLLQAGQQLSVPVSYTVPASMPTLKALAAKFFTSVSNLSVVQKEKQLKPNEPLDELAHILSGQISPVTSDGETKHFLVPASPVNGNSLNSLNLIGVYFGVSPQRMQLLNPNLQPERDLPNPTEVLPAGTPVVIPAIRYIVPPITTGGIERHFGLAPGTLQLPSPGAALKLTATYTIQESDSLFGIAAYLGVSIDVVIEAAVKASLNPGFSLVMPPFAHAIASGENLTTIAHQYSLTVRQLVLANAETPLLEAGQTMSVPGAVAVERLLDLLDTPQAAGKQPSKTAVVAQGVNRFMLHGQRLPPPGARFPKTQSDSAWAMLETQPLYALTGQMFEVTTDVPSAMAIAVTPNGVPKWLNLSQKLTMELDAQEIAALQAISKETIPIQPPQAMKAWASAPQQFSFGHNEVWQCAESMWSTPQSLQGSPLIWPFTSDLDAATTKAATTGLPLNLRIATWSGDQLVNTGVPTAAAWSAMVELQLRPVQTVTGSEGAAGNLCSVSLDPANTALLDEIINWKIPAGDSLVLSLLYSPPSGQSGYVSDIAGSSDRQNIVLLSLEPSDACAASMDQATTFLDVLRRSPYLDYRTAASPMGLPSYLFSSDVVASVSLLVMLMSTSQPEKTAVPGWCNAAATPGNINLNDSVLIAEAPHLPSEQVKIPLGYMGFSIPEAAAPTAPLAQQYQLLGYEFQDAGGKPTSVEGPGISPSHPQGSEGFDAPWLYNKILPIPGFEPVAAAGFQATPPAAANPYAQVKTDGSSVNLGFHLHDLYGNRYQPSVLAKPLRFQFRYYDPMICLSQWPSVAAGFSFSTSLSGTPQLDVQLGFSVAKYQPAAERTIEQCTAKAAVDLQKYRQIYYQIHQPDVTYSVSTSIGTVSPSFEPRMSDLRSFVKGIYAYLATVQYLGEQQLLTTPTYTVDSQPMTLSELAGRFLLESETLADANRNVAGLLQSRTVALPVQYAAVQGDSLNSISLVTTSPPFNRSAAISPQEIARANAFTENALLPGVSLQIGKVEYTIQAGDTLASIAHLSFARSVTVDEIANQNADVKLFQAGVVLTLYTAPRQAGPHDTIMTLLDIASREPANRDQGIQPGLSSLIRVNDSVALAAGTTLTIPQRTQFEASKPLPEGLTLVTADDSQDSLAGLAGDLVFDQTELYLSNLSRADILDASQRITFALTATPAAGSTSPLNVTVALRTNETLGTLQQNAAVGIAARLIDEFISTAPVDLTLAFPGDSATLSVKLTKNTRVRRLANALQEQLTPSDFAVLIAQQKIIKDGAVLLRPPAECTIHDRTSTGVPVTAPSPAELVQITADLTLNRAAELVDPSLTGGLKTQVASATTPLPPLLGPMPAEGTSSESHSPQTLSAVQFATRFENTFPSLLLATDRESKSGQVRFWGVPIAQKQAISLDVDMRSRAFYLPPPLCTSLVSADSVSVPKYGSSQGLIPDAARVDFQSVDMDVWARKFLKTFDRVLSPQALANIHRTAPDVYQTLLESRKKLIEHIAASIQPVVAVDGADAQDRVGAASSTLKERLQQGLENAYRIDSIVQLQSSVKPVAAPPPANVTLAQAASLMHVSTPELVAACLVAPVLKKGATVEINGTTQTVDGQRITNLQTLLVAAKAWDRFQFHTTEKNEALLDSLCNTAGLLVEHPPLKLISYAENGGQINIPVTGTEDRQVTQVGNKFNDPKLLGYILQSFYVVDVLKDVEGVFAGSAIPAVQITGKNQAYTIKQTDKLSDVLASENFQGVTLWGFVIKAGPNLKIAEDIKSLGFNIETMKGSGGAKTNQLSLAGKLSTGATTIPAQDRDNTLKGIQKSLAVKTERDIPLQYIAEVIQDLAGIFNGSPISYQTRNYKPDSDDTLADVLWEFQHSDPELTLPELALAVGDQQILNSGMVINLHWSDFGQPLTLQFVAGAFEVSVRDLIWSNFGTPDVVAGGKPLSSVKALWAEGTLPNDHLPKSITSDTSLLAPDPPLGMLRYESSGGGVTVPTTANRSLLDYAEAVGKALPSQAAVNVSYLANEIQNVEGLYAARKLILGSKSYTPGPDDSLSDIAGKFGLDAARLGNQLGTKIEMIGGRKLQFGWKPLAGVLPRTTLSDVANYFDVEPVDLIQANWTQPGLFSTGAKVDDHTIASNDTFQSLAKALNSKDKFPDSTDPFVWQNNVIGNPDLLKPTAILGILELQSGVSLSPVSISLQQHVPQNLTTAFKQAGTPRRRCGLNLSFTPTAVQVGSQQPKTIVRPPTYQFGSLEVPLPLRSYPTAPTLSKQSADPVEPPGGQALSLNEATAWNYQMTYSSSFVSQDEIELDLAFNAGGQFLGGQDDAKYNKPLFEALAGFVNVYASLKPDLNALSDADADDPTLRTAIAAFAKLADQISDAWNPPPRGQMLTSGGTGAEKKFGCTISELYDPTQQVLTISVNKTGGDTLPGEYQLPLVVADSETWHQPDNVANAVPTFGTAASYVYKLKPGGDPSSGLRRAVQFNNQFNILNYRNVWAGVAVSRNLHLLSGVTTNPAFIFETPQVRFPKPLTPVIDQMQRVRFFQPYNGLVGGSKSTQELMRSWIEALFDELCGHSSSFPASIHVQLAAGYEFGLSASGTANLNTWPTPLLMQHSRPLDDAFISHLSSALADWQKQRTEGVYRFDLTIVDCGSSLPILRLRNLQMNLQPHPIHQQRYLPEPDPGQASWATDADSVNPLVVNISAATDVTINTVTKAYLSYGDPVRIKSWISGMVWSDNQTIYYNDKQPALSRQVPIYADPLIGLYVCPLPQAVDDKEITEYTDYFIQSGNENQPDSEAAVYGETGWEAGFHLCMPNPTVNNGAAYNSGTGPKTYNNDCLIFNAEGRGFQPGAGADWLAASTAKPFHDNPSWKDFQINSELPPSAFQSGICQYGTWRDTLSVSPVKRDGDEHSLAFAPNAARLVQQGDFHARFVMENDAPGHANQQLQMTLVQGSPFATFLAAGVDGVRISGIFSPTNLPDKNTFKLIPGGVHQDIGSPWQIHSLKSPAGGPGVLNYVIIYQQVNLFYTERIGQPDMSGQRSNWVSFAVFWDPEIVDGEAQVDQTTLVLCFKQPLQDHCVVVAGLPSQMSNGAPGEQPDFVPLRTYAEQIGPYAFNVVRETRVSYEVTPADRSGPANVETRFQFVFEKEPAGPVAQTDTTVVLLQPHQYLDPCDPKGSVLAPGTLKPLWAESPPGGFNYWISRGRLAPYYGADFSLNYTYPNMLPRLPLFDLDARRKGNVTPPAEHDPVPVDFNLTEMAAAMLGFTWVADFPSSDNKPGNGPATTSLGNSHGMQGTYNAGKGFLRAAKMLPMLVDMVKSNHFNDDAVMNLIDGTSKYLGGRSIYCVGNANRDGVTYFTPGLALHDMIERLMEAFRIYFGGDPEAHIARSVDDQHDRQVRSKSYYYSYYDNRNRHLFMYPAAGAGGPFWPTNRKFAEDPGYKAKAVPIIDGFGTVSMLNDHAYTYGYLIAAAAMLGFVLKDSDLMNSDHPLKYNPIDNTTGKVENKQVPVCSPDEIEAWSEWIEVWTPVIDQLVMDIAHDPDVDSSGGLGFQSLGDLEYPKFEYMDAWSGMSWTDGFLQHEELQGHNVNSPWEQMLAWVGIVMWGQATARPQIVDLGKYLFTTALYNLEVYRYNVTQTYVPHGNGSDHSDNGDFLPRAVNNFLDQFGFYPSGREDGPYSPLTFARQNFVGRSMWDTMMSDSREGVLPADQYPFGSADHRTSHVTYLYQGNVRCDNTYWNSPIGMLSTSIYPHGPYSQAMSRQAAYMSDWLNALWFQNGLSYFQLSYPTTVNLLLAMLGRKLSVVGKDASDNYNRTGSPDNKITPIPMQPGDFGYAPTPGEKGANPGSNAFYQLSMDSNLAPYDWFWQKCSDLNPLMTSDDRANPPWKNTTSGETLSMYAPGDKTEAETLLYFYSYDKYGSPDFSYYAAAAWKTRNSKPLIEPLSMAWAKTAEPTADAVAPTVIRTFMVYNPNPAPIEVSFQSREGGEASLSQTVGPYELKNWKESSEPPDGEQHDLPGDQ